MTRRSLLVSMALSVVLSPLACSDGGQATDTVDTVEPDTADTADTVEADTADTIEPDTNDSIEPDTAAPDTIGPDTRDTLVDDTSDTAEPDVADTQDSVDTRDTQPAPTCEIDGETFEADAIDPANVCQRCVPATSTSTWTAASGPVTLFDGARAYADQGWSLFAMEPLTTAIVDGALELATTTEGPRAGGAALLYRALPLPAGSAYTLEVDLRVVSVSKHNQYDAAAAIMPSYGGSFGTLVDRSQAIYLDPDAIGWFDDQASSAVAITDGAFHTVRVAVDASNSVTVSVDGTEHLHRDGFSGNGSVAIGDQTNDNQVDGTMSLRAVRLLCP